MSLCVVGSINADLTVNVGRHPTPGETLMGSGGGITAGGKGANQAVAAAKLGTPVVLVGAVGADANAEPATALLRDAGVDLAHVEDVNDVTGLAVITVAAGDTVRWIVGDTSSGAGDELRVNVLVKPVRSGLKTNLVITTNRRTYLLELTSTERAWMASVSWDYPKDRMLALQRQAQAAQVAAPVDTGLSLERIRFRYAISGSNPSWKPLRAFDDGEKVYIQFPAGIAQGELPPLFVIGVQGDGQLVNYRFRSPYYIVDRLFGAAELRLGGDKGDVVRIERTDGVARRN